MRLLLVGCSFNLAVSCTDLGEQPAELVQPESELVATAREQPDSTRDTIARALRLAAWAPKNDNQAAHLTTAHAHARAYAAAWNDSFFVRRVAWFEAATDAKRRAAADADSLWRAGRAAVGQQGVPTAMHYWHESLNRADAAGDSAGRALAIFAIGAGFSIAGEFDSATVYLNSGYELARAVGDHRTMGNALGALANVSKDRGELSRAVELYQQAGVIRARSGDSRGVAADQNNLGLIARSLGDLDAAREAFERVLALNRAERRDLPAARNLDNLGDIASIRGDYATAQAHYEEALSINRAAGDVAETGFVLHDLGLLATRRGDYPTAIAALSEALSTHEQSGALLEAVSVRADLAVVQAAIGDFENALRTLRKAEDLATAAGTSATTRARLALARADLAVQFGSFAQAEQDYSLAGQLFTEIGDDAGRADVYQGRAVLLLMRDDHTGALQLLEHAARAQTSIGDRRSWAITQVLAGEVQSASGDTTAARRSFTSALGFFRRLADPVGEAGTFVALGDLAMRRNAPVAAETLYRSGLQRLADQRVPDMRWRLHAGLAGAFRMRGTLAAAADQLNAAIHAIESVAADLRGEERRSAFIADKWQVYAALAGVEQARGRAAESFAVSERMRARQMLAMLNRGRVQARPAESTREQDLRRQITELTTEIAAAERDGDGRRELPLGDEFADAAREALAAAQKEYTQLLLAMKETQPSYAQLVTASFVEWQDVAAALASDEILLEYLLADSSSTVFVVTSDTVVSLDLGVGRQAIANLVDFARHAMSRPDASQTSTLWPGALRRLDDYLIEPVRRAGFLEGRRSIVIIPHADLHFLPFGALVAAEPAGGFLVERFEISYATSASVWVHQVKRPPSSFKRVLALAPHTTRLPASREEVDEIRAVFGRRNTRLLFGSAASKQALLSNLSGYGIVHFATFGVLNKHNPLFSYVELAPAGADDGRLEVHEVFDLDLAGQLVVLSACQTAVGSGTLADVPPGDDWVGLMQAFVQAGAGSVLASLWPVDDRRTAMLMKDFYRVLATGANGAAALAAAQRTMLHAPETAHPFYWAGFVMSGTSNH